MSEENISDYEDLITSIKGAYESGKIDNETYYTLYKKAVAAGWRMKKLDQDLSHLSGEVHAIHTACDKAVSDVLFSPVEVVEASLYKKFEAQGDKLSVQGLRWYVQVTLRNINEESEDYGTDAMTLYRVWVSHGEWKAIRVDML